MNKKNLGRITALGIASLTAVPTFSIVASADVGATIWVVPITTSGGSTVYTYYDTEAHAKKAAPEIMDNYGNVTQLIFTKKASDHFTVGQKYDIDGLGQITISSSGFYTYGTSSGGTSSSTSYYSGYAYATDRVYYSTLTQRYYPNATAFLNDPANKGQKLPGGVIPSQPYDSEHTWFDYASGEYIRPTDYTGNAYYISGGKNNAYNDVSSTSSGRYTVYYSSSTKKFYDSWEAARADSPSSSYVTTYYSNYTATELNNGYGSTYNYDWSSYVSAYYPWYSYVTGRYYATQAEALKYSNNDSSKVINAYNYYYNNNYVYGYYYDPNYYYWNTLYNNNSTTTKDTSAVTIGKSKGWTSVIRTINSAKAGASYTVNMNTETEITENVLKALKGKNVTINFKFSNGAIFTLNGNDITSTSAISPTVKYGSTSIPSSLKKKAVKANNGVSSSQLNINGGSFGATASITVKFNSKRSGCSAKLYRYNYLDNTLSLVSRSTVQSNGQCEFGNVKQGGEYIVVLS